MSRLQQPSTGPGLDGAVSRPERRPSPAGRPAGPASVGLPIPTGTESPRPIRSYPSFRFGNTVLAAGLLVLSAPVLILAALAVRVTSTGPVIYRQPRIGLDRRSGGRAHLGDRRKSDLGGRPFHIYKFRTMYHRSGPQGRQVWTRPNDRRVTPVGRVLRAYRLDEFPQMVNVLKGDMNVVGPRPEQPQIFARLREQFEHYPDRQRVPPGITGLAQIRCGYGGTTSDVQRKLSFDLEYLERRSLLLDLWVLLRTVPVVLFKRGAR